MLNNVYRTSIFLYTAENSTFFGRPFFFPFEDNDELLIYSERQLASMAEIVHEKCNIKQYMFYYFIIIVLIDVKL